MRLEKKLLNQMTKDAGKYLEDVKRTDEKVAHSKAIYKGQPVPYLHIPRIFEPEDIKCFEEATAGIFDIVNVSINAYLENGNIRKLYGFDPRLEALIRLPHYYKTKVPMGRFDIFYYGEAGYYFCELNADGASAMNEEYELTQILTETQIMNEAKEKYQFESFELFRSWTEKVKKIYGEYCHNLLLEEAERPFVAIVDFIDKGSSLEFEVFKATFIENGFDCEIVDPRDIVAKAGASYYKDQKIDIVYRRLVTKDLMDRYDDIPDFIAGIENNHFCLIGSIKSQIIHTKRFFEVLYTDEMQALLTDKQKAFIKAHIPYTMPLKQDKMWSEYLENPKRYIIKPVDYYASKGVIAGQDCQPSEWQKILEEKVKEDYIIQEYCPLSLTENIVYNSEGDFSVHTFKNITGLFVYDESFAGVYSRAGLHAIISGLHDGFTLSSIALKK